jgi:nickel superoxide dismutase
MIHRLLETLDQKYGFEQASAHCDVPCGIYDPIVAELSALTVVRMLDLMAAKEAEGGEKNPAYYNSMARYIAVKEEHAEKAKAEIRVIWGDFFKAPQFEMFPDAHSLVHKIMMLGSKARQTTDRDNALQFVEAVNQFAEMFWKVKNIETHRAKYPMAPNLELVFPNL